MKAFDKYFGDAYEPVDVIKFDEKNFVAAAYDKNSKRLCVLKKRDLKSAEVYKTLKALDSPHVPKIYRLFERDGNLFVIEEHIDGQTLDEILTYQILNFDEKLAEKILLQICDCLEKIHEKNIIHRDLTPSNIMLTKNNFVKLIDFGIARIFKPEKNSDTEFLGTRGYAAPEQYGLFDLGQTDPRTDIFILGSTMKKLLGENYHGLLTKILNRCTNLSPDSRYNSAADLILDIKRTRKIFWLKRCGLIFSGAIIFFFATNFINFDEKKEPTSEEIDSEKIFVDELEKIPEVEKPAQIPQKMPEFVLPALPTPQQIPESVAPVMPTPQEIPEPIQPKKAERVKLYLYINGKLTEDWSEHSTAGDFYISDDYQNWQHNGDVFLFPVTWTARVKVENFTDKDLITPRFVVDINGEKIFIDKPTVKAGEIIYFDIPIANKNALKISGEDNISGELSIAVESPSGSLPILIRYLKV